MKRTLHTHPDPIIAQARRLRWQHGLTPRMARTVAELAYGRAA